MMKIKAPQMVFVKGEEMTAYAMDLILDAWIKPHLDISAWQFFDLSCKSRDNSSDKVLSDLIEAGRKVKSIFKEPTITPTEEQKEKFGLSKAWGSPNGAMRRGWNGVTISRDTIHIKGLELGYKNKVTFDRHAVGGEYGAGYKMTGKGRVRAVYIDESGNEHIIDERKLDDEQNAVVLYHNPLDNVEKMAEIFFARCLEERVVPYVTTKKTVFKWQESFWQIMKDYFDKNYKHKFKDVALLPQGDLVHIISDAATMKLVAWRDGGFGMASHNYDGDMLSDLMSQVHKSPGFISSCLVGISESGEVIKEFEASHGTVSDMYKRMKDGGETSFNPLGMVYALCEAMRHSGNLYGSEDIKSFANVVYDSLCQVMASGRGTKDLCGKDGSTTEQFIELVAKKISQSI